MTLDSSAIVAILRAEPEQDAFIEAIASAAWVGVSAGTVLESTVVVGRSRRPELDELLVQARARILAVDEQHLEAAQEGWTRFGKGSGSPARLDYGDCFAYAAAKVTKAPLLYKGEDFGHTDVVGAL